MILFKFPLSRRNTCYDINTPSYVDIITEYGRVSYFFFHKQSGPSNVSFTSHRLRLPVSPDLLDSPLSGTEQEAESAKVWIAH